MKIHDNVWWAVWFVCIALVLFCGYAFSVGPAFWMVQHDAISLPFFGAVYGPLTAIAESTGLYSTLVDYIHWWSPEPTIR